jgi:hypothetical protein
MKTQILCSINFYENRTVYEIMSKNIVETEAPKMTSQYGLYTLHTGLARLYACMRMHTHTHTQQYVILIAFPQQQWFRERASMLRYTYIACLVLFRNESKLKYATFANVIFCEV